MHLGFVITLLFLVLNSVSAQNSRFVQFEILLTERVGSEIKKIKEELKKITGIFNNTITQIIGKNQMELEKQSTENIELRKELKGVKDGLSKTTKWKMENEKGIAELLKLLQINCDVLFKMGKVNSGVEKIYPFTSHVNFIQAYCEYIVEGEYQGGWTVIQRRDDNVNKRENFKRNWVDYVNGFGRKEEEYWIGLNAIHALTNSQPMQLLITLEDWEGTKEIVYYRNFKIDDEHNNFRIDISGFKGNVANSLDRVNKHYFSTNDKDNDFVSRNCAESEGGGTGFWYRGCYRVNLNGNPIKTKESEFGGIHWWGYKPNSSNQHPLRRVKMMVKPLN